LKNHEFLTNFENSFLKFVKFAFSTYGSEWTRHFRYKRTLCLSPSDAESISN